MVQKKRVNVKDCEEILRSLSVDRQLSCALVKDYTSLRMTALQGVSIHSPDVEKENSVREQLESLLQDSVENVKALEAFWKDIDNDATTGAYELCPLDIIAYWKRDIALRIVLLNSVPICDAMDLQRLLFMWLDSPYKHKLPFENS
ncbi:hypothetical protein BgAZ_500870 [Babesia gibsoni]|uniref:Uncharacterized protein n=1 Tax=Babesia gibsoni TaxID=33632 RepID=A0AAD8LFQ9_BABGI|nr:hypothetical protein BgAZ_500870 [Babesia gibsoni]